VRIPTEIPNDLLGAAERPFGIHDPVGAVQAVEPRVESRGV
jgi:hypothetical protein